MICTNHDDSIIALTTVVFATEFQGKSMDAICADKESLNKLTALCSMMDRKLKQLDDYLKHLLKFQS